jgi:hypothetical protein
MGGTVHGAVEGANDERVWWLRKLVERRALPRGSKLVVDAFSRKYTRP